MSQSTDPFAEIQSVLFRGWATAFTACSVAAENTLIAIADWAFKEGNINAVGRDDIDIEAPVGALLAAAGDFVYTEDSVPVKDPKPDERIPAAQVSFEPPTVPAPVPPAKRSEVLIKLDPVHEVRTGEYLGQVKAGDAVLAKDVIVYVGG